MLAINLLRDGAFPGLLSATEPASSPGAAVTEASDLDATLR